MHKLAFGYLVLLFCIAQAHAQSFTTGPCHGDEGNTNKSWFLGHQEQVCELRQTTLPLVNGKLSVSGMSGGIEVMGEDRSDVLLEAHVITQGSSRKDAESFGHKIKIVTDGTIKAEGPMMIGWSRSSWTVNYKLRVPRHLTAHLHTINGGINIMNIDGVIDADTTNGGVTLQNLAGDVHARTANGGLEITLAGDQWQGSGLVAKSINGSVSVKAPKDYSAHLIANTMNGDITVDFPMMVHGTIHNHIDTDLGRGGATIHFETVNGPVSVARFGGA